MTEAVKSFGCEVQLLAWSNTSTKGPTITLQLSDEEDLEFFKLLTMAKGRGKTAIAGQRFMAGFAEIGDDEKPVVALELMRPLVKGGISGMCGYCRNDLWLAVVFDGQEMDCPSCKKPLWFEVEKDGVITQHPGRKPVAVTGETGPGIGPLCLLAVQLCKNENFFAWGIEMGDIPLNALDCYSDAHCKNMICGICKIESRKELDTNPMAERIFHEQIRRPFAEWCHANGVET